MKEQLTPAPVVERDTEVQYPDFDGVNDRDLDLMQIYRRGFQPKLSREQETEYSKRIEAGKFAEYLRDHPETQGPNKVEADELEWLIDDGNEALDDFIAANLAYVVSIAKRYQGHGVPLLDIIQEGNKGLLTAAWKFDYQKGYKFSTYATDRIIRDISRGMAENSRNVRLPREKYEALIQLNRARGKFFQEYGRDATIDELTGLAKMSAEQITDLIDIAPDTFSLDAPIHPDEQEDFSDLVWDGESDAVTKNAEYADLRTRVKELLSRLSPEEQGVIRRSFGFTGREWSGPQIGAEFGRTGQWARDTRRKAIAHLGKIASPMLAEFAPE